jgi:hypothetical protein
MLSQANRISNRPERILGEIDGNKNVADATNKAFNFGFWWSIIWAYEMSGVHSAGLSHYEYRLLDMLKVFLTIDADAKAAPHRLSISNPILQRSTRSKSQKRTKIAPDADRRESAWPLRKTSWRTGSQELSDDRVERLFNGFRRSLFYNFPLVKNGYARGGKKIRQIRRFEDRIKSGPFLLRERINF